MLSVLSRFCGFDQVVGVLNLVKVLGIMTEFPLTGTSVSVPAVRPPGVMEVFGFSWGWTGSVLGIKKPKLLQVTKWFENLPKLSKYS